MHQCNCKRLVHVMGMFVIEGWLYSLLGRIMEAKSDTEKDEIPPRAY